MGEGASTASIKIAVSGRVQAAYKKQTAGTETHGTSQGAMQISDRVAKAVRQAAVDTGGSPSIALCTVCVSPSAVCASAGPVETGWEARIHLCQEQARGRHLGDDTGGPGHRDASTLHK